MQNNDMIKKVFVDILRALGIGAKDVKVKLKKIKLADLQQELNLLGINLVPVADRAFYQRGGTENTKNKLKRRLNELFSRRNIIAHQSDRSHTDAQVNTITKEIVQNFICDIEKIVRSIDAEAKNK